MNDEELAQVIALRHDLHAHPELSGKEERTRRVLMDFVQQHSDFEVVPCQGCSDRVQGRHGCTAD